MDRTVKRNQRAPEAIPFRRGNTTPRRAPVAMAWISPSMWSALQGEGTDTHRLASGAGMWLERFGPDLLLSYQNENDRALLLAELESRCGAYAFQPRRVFGKFLPRQA